LHGDVTTPHPEDTHPLGTQHDASPEEKRINMTLAIALVTTVILIPIIAVVSASPLLNVLLGFSPLIITLVLDIMATHQHFKPVAYWAILAIVHALGLAILGLINFVLNPHMNVPGAIAVSVILASIVTALCLLHQRPDRGVKRQHVVEFKPEKLEEYVNAIEDKIKGMNFVIGRVYRASNGATPKMRERLKVPSDWYNEFHAIKPEDLEDQKGNAKVLIRKIRDRLSLYIMKEKDVFSPEEIKPLKHIVRHKDGHDTILQILKTNDRDPVEHYYVSAVEFCDRILEELEKQP
jgi:hypothetical protein